MTRVALFVLLLAAVFAAAFGIGRVAPVEAAAPAEEEHAEDAMPEADGLAVAAHGFRLVLEGADPVSFRIVDDRGATVHAYDELHERRMHLVVVRRDLTGFRHVHPVQQPDGSWRSDLRLGEAPGTYRVFADFSSGGERAVLGTDVSVAGASRPEPLPRTRGFDVRLRPHAALRAGEPVALEFATPGVRPAPYLGARGHLVVLRAGDLGYLHTHPESDELVFETTFPSAGAYRAFLQVRVGGRVHTKSFDLRVSE